MIEIRSLREDDGVEDLITLSRIFFNEYQIHHKEFFKIDNLSDGDILGYFSKIRNKENGEVIVALDGDRIVGYITVYVRVQSDHWEVKKIGVISGLMVHPAYRRMGIATQLLAAAENIFKRGSVKHFTVYTAVNNQGAIKFYEKCGLAPLHTTLIGEIGGPIKKK
jgi:ribosomal protein S18 acetylase RimI-like enzyme